MKERYRRYIAFDGSQYVYNITTSFDPLAETGTFEELDDFETFVPYLKTLIAALDLPHPDW